MSVLDSRSLNRAALARQLLLDRADLPVPDAVAHLGGLQAQEPQEPFVGLWSRLRDFAPRALDDLLTGRRVVRTHLMRRTVHLVTAEDVLAWRSRHDAMLRGRVLGTYRRELEGVDLDELAAAGRAVLADGEPRSMAALARAVAERWPGVGSRPLGEMLVAALIPTVQLPPRGLWRVRAPVRNAPVAAWLGRAVDPPAPPGTDPVGAALVRRYLAAFGPAASADLRAWCGLAGLPAAVAAVRGELVAFRDERGRELLDLPDAPRPVGHRRPFRPGRRPGRRDLDRGGRHGGRHPAAPAHPAGAHRGRRGGAGPGVLPHRRRERPGTGRDGTVLSRGRPATARPDRVRRPRRRRRPRS